VWGAAGREEEARTAALDQGLRGVLQGAAAGVNAAVSLRQVVAGIFVPDLGPRGRGAGSPPAGRPGQRKFDGVHSRGPSSVELRWAAWGDVAMLLCGLQAGIRRGSSWASSAAAALDGRSA
jgi:hypothetical protein